MLLQRPIISAEELATNLNAVRVLDCRARLGDPHAGGQAYAAGHIPGAIHADLDQDLADPPGKNGRHPLPARDRWLATCRRWGLNDEDAIVAYDDAGGAFAARAWWMLRWLGHGNVAVLDGGLQAWQRAQPDSLLTQATQTAPGTFSDRRPLTRTVTAQDIASMPATLVDARARARFEGREEPIDHTAGHIPGAVCLPNSENLNADGGFKSSETLAARFADLNGDIICYCGSGVTAAHNILAMISAGLPEPALYPGSWSEWIEDPSRPIATGP